MFDKKGDVVSSTDNHIVSYNTFRRNIVKIYICIGLCASRKTVTQLDLSGISEMLIDFLHVPGVHAFSQYNPYDIIQSLLEEQSTSKVLFVHCDAVHCLKVVSH